LICELGIIASTFIFLRNEVAWQQWLKEAGRSGGSREKMAMLIGSIVATACVIFLTLIGHGNITSGFKNAFKCVREVSKIAASANLSMLSHLKLFKTFIHPDDKDADPKQEEEASVARLHDLKNTSAATSK
jgi:hypothetical protein